ncbi:MULTISPECIES: urease accessory protein UreD [Planktothrix]|jgi:urease accessory protein|uniref:Urease accessory protein UreD n=1 Tax=Planktothrix rubescens CCAP 1459/22 TaxID=329571 RepID=A0A6J7ZJ05_PLARU|nr:MULTISPECIES: urease accessory protein UreD [Planktothrix]CAD5933610.1 Urease accessory protein UreD [Planktothrix rubescens]MBG0745409.1 urease accessory protein UreD [Planktothrix agardhii KL2]CAC5341177.1 Urease accessory protein UreD [Planktothrix rubescens NIVA-CYA 18]CAD5933324.1 Urease accessory protein UreD [Planktothrix rubescens NIVA-CYA 18]CAH2571973.1 Urease accessory protein UreD [Planktothrix rubescens]
MKNLEINPSQWQGILELDYQKINNSTQLVKAYSQAPLKIQRSFYPEGKDICHSIILHTAGGMVGGDRLSQTINLQPETQVLLTTPAASKIYRSSGETAQNTINIEIQEQAYLEFIPREIIIFNGAIFSQNLRVNLDPNACYLGWEITRFGRTARGEIFNQGQWKSCTEIWQNGCPVWIDRQGFIANEEILNSPHGLGGKPVIATLTWVGQPVSEDIVKNIRQLWSQRETSSQAGVTQLISGLLCRYRGNSTQEVINWFTDVWQLLRQNYTGKSIVKPRVWQL